MLWLGAITGYSNVLAFLKGCLGLEMGCSLVQFLRHLAFDFSAHLTHPRQVN